MGVDYFNTFIVVAPDCAAPGGIVPPERGGEPTVARRTFDLISSAPYRYTSADVIFQVWADRREIPEADRPAERERFYSKGQACLRASDLGKRYGWGIHSDEEGRVAVYALGSEEYRVFADGRTDPRTGAEIVVTPAMRSSR